MYITKKYNLHAAHRTRNPHLSDTLNEKIYGKCNRQHGHNYTVDVTFEGDIVPDRDIMIIQKDLEEALDSILNKFNNIYLNNLNLIFRHNNPTTENIIYILWHQFSDLSILLHKDILKKYKIKLHKIRLRETARNYFDYYGPDKNIQLF